MALYLVRFLDRSEKVSATHHVEHDDDEAAVAAAHHLNIVTYSGVAFEVWDDERLVRRLRANAPLPKSRGYRPAFVSSYSVLIWAAFAVTAADYVTCALVPRLASLGDIVAAAILATLGIVVWRRKQVEGKLALIDYVGAVLLILAVAALIGRIPLRDFL